MLLNIAYLVIILPALLGLGMSVYSAIFIEGYLGFTMESLIPFWVVLALSTSGSYWLIQKREKASRRDFVPTNFDRKMSKFANVVLFSMIAILFIFFINYFYLKFILILSLE